MKNRACEYGLYVDDILIILLSVNCIIFNGLKQTVCFVYFDICEWVFVGQYTLTFIDEVFLAE